MKALLIHDKDLGPVDICSEHAGGIAVYLTQLVRGLRERGWGTAAVSFRARPRPPAPDAPRELQAFRYRLRPSVLAELDAIIDAEDPDVVHLHSMPMLHPVVVRRLVRARPVVWTFHDVSPLCFRGTRLRRPDGTPCERRLGLGCVTGGCFRPGADGSLPGDIARVLGHRVALRAYRQVPSVVVPSGYMASLFAAHGIADERIDVVPLFSRFEDRGVAPMPVTDEPVILFAGRLTREKGLIELIEALATLPGAGWRARIVGEGPLRGDAETRIARYGLAERVTFLGAVGATELEAEYRACSVVVMPSLAMESFGLVGVEAMSFGRPVVAFASGGVVEWLEDGVTGLLATHGDAGQLGLHLTRLIEDQTLRERLGAAGHARLLASFGRDRHLDRMTAVYESAIEAQGRRAALAR